MIKIIDVLRESGLHLHDMYVIGNNRIYRCI